jgi:hypothetical protein
MIAQLKLDAQAVIDAAYDNLTRQSLLFMMVAAQAVVPGSSPVAMTMPNRYAYILPVEQWVQSIMTYVLSVAQTIMQQTDDTALAALNESWTILDTVGPAPAVTLAGALAITN